MKNMLAKCGFLIAGVIIAEIYEELQSRYWDGRSPSLAFFYTWREVRKKVKERENEHG